MEGKREGRQLGIRKRKRERRDIGADEESTIHGDCQLHGLVPYSERHTHKRTYTYILQ